MAIDLRNATSFPWPYRKSLAAALTWEEVKLPVRARKVTITIEGEAGMVAFPGRGDPGVTSAPTDGGAVDTHYQPLTADAGAEFVVRAEGSPRLSSESVFVARSSTAGYITVTVEE